MCVLKLLDIHYDSRFAFHICGFTIPIAPWPVYDALGKVLASFYVSLAKAGFILEGGNSVEKMCWPEWPVRKLVLYFLD